MKLRLTPEISLRPGATAPDVVRSPMRAQPWFGLWRGLLFALWPGQKAAAAQRAPAGWHETARQRRQGLLAVVFGLGLVAATAQALQAPTSPDALWWAYSAMLVLLMAWVGAGFATAVAGAWTLWKGDASALRLADPRAPINPQARTAIVMPVCNEDIATVFSGLRATCESLAVTGALSLFDIYVLSDTSDPALRAAELQAWERLRRIMGDDPVLAGGRVFYRWRRRRTRRKAGNVADFCRRWGRNYRYMVVLDADSTMHGDTLVSLVRLMEAHPRAGIVQTLPQPCGHGTLHARAQQFAHRVTGRLFSLGMAWWQLGDSHYWGHNAIIRVEPFMRHCGMGALPGRGGLSGEIMSHDFVEAAMMARAGYEVWLAPDLSGSWEQNPPHLLDELQRDRRWCQGNLQNLRLVAEPGWRPAHRVMLGTAAFSYAVAPFWLLFLVLGTASGAHQSSWLWGLTLTLLFLPRVLALAAVVLRGEQKAYGGTLRLIGGAVMEAVVSAFQAPVRMLAHTLFVVVALTGLKLDWKSPTRQAEGIAWRDAWQRLSPLVLPVLLLAGVALGLQALLAPAWWLILVPLLLSVPQAVASASPALGRWIERRGLLWNPEERQPPRTLARASDQRSFVDLAPAQARSSLAVSRSALARPRAVLALGVLMLATLMSVPRLGLAPELPAWARLSVAPVAIPDLSAFAGSEANGPAQPSPRTMPSGHRREARMIDNAVRTRAMKAVERALRQEAEETVQQLESA